MQLLRIPGNSRLKLKKSMQEQQSLWSHSIRKNQWSSSLAWRQLLTRVLQHRSLPLIFTPPITAFLMTMTTMMASPLVAPLLGAATTAKGIWRPGLHAAKGRKNMALLMPFRMTTT
jgi:hypothetical protein